MAQQSEDKLSNAQKKQTRVTFATALTNDDNNDVVIDRSKWKVHVNISLESEEIVGFVKIKDNKKPLLSLSNLRSEINEQFDEDQFETFGGFDNFKFITNTTPISKKQEAFIQIDEIAISQQCPSSSPSLYPSSPLRLSTTHSNDALNFNDTKSKKIRHKSLDIPNDHCSHTRNRCNSEAVRFDRIPHHLSPSPFISNSPVRSPTNLLLPPYKNHQRTSKQRVVTKKKTKLRRLSKSINNENIYYCVIVRSIKSKNNSPNTQNMEEPQQQMIHRQASTASCTSMSIFDTINLIQPSNGCKDSSTDEDDIQSEETSVDLMDPCEFSPKDKKTALEIQFGGSLPRIRDNKRKNERFDHIQMTNILANALQVRDDTNTFVGASSHMDTNGGEYDSLIGDDKNNKKLIVKKDKQQQQQQQCKFTVTGCSDRNGLQQTWMFRNPSDLIVGLQGVHHSESSPIWMDIVCDADTFIKISEHVRPRIHSLTIEDCATPECREKLELFDDYLFICIHTSVTEKLCIIVFKTMILTYHTTMNGVGDSVIAEARHRLAKRHKSSISSPGWVIHTIIDVIVDRMIPEVECRVQEVQNVENLVFQLSGSSQDELLQRLQIARNWLMVYTTRLWQKSTMTHNLCSNEWRSFLGGVQQQYWNDINDHVARMVDLINLGQSTLETCQNVFVAMISLEMSDQSNTLNESAQRFTAVGSIFLPLTFFAGLWGMNCKVPFQYEGPYDDPEDEFMSDDFYGFIIIFCCMIVTAIVTYRYSRKMI